MKPTTFELWFLAFPHILAGLIALGAGAVALSTQKGSLWHRRSGITFAISMLLMGLTGTVIAALITPAVSVIAGCLTAYLVATAWLTVKPNNGVPSLQNLALTTAAALTAMAAMFWGFEAVNSTTGTKHGFPPGPHFIFGAIAILAVLGDIQLLRRGAIAGNQRLARHLWRMGVAMLIATSAAFRGQARLFSSEIRESGMLTLPVVAVAIALLYWLARVALAKRKIGMSSQ